MKKSELKEIIRQELREATRSPHPKVNMAVNSLEEAIGYMENVNDSKFKSASRTIRKMYDDLYDYADREYPDWVDHAEYGWNK